MNGATVTLIYELADGETAIYTESAESSGEASGDASGASSEEPSGEASGEGSDFEITVDGVTDIAHFEDADNGDEATKSFVITFDGREITGAIDHGVWTADSGDAADQAIVEAVQAAYESGGSGEPSGDASGQPS